MYFKIYYLYFRINLNFRRVDVFSYIINLILSGVKILALFLSLQMLKKGKGSERRKSLRRKSKKEHRKSN